MWQNFCFLSSFFLSYFSSWWGAPYLQLFTPFWVLSLFDSGIRYLQVSALFFSISTSGLGFVPRSQCSLRPAVSHSNPFSSNPNWSFLFFRHFTNSWMKLLSLVLTEVVHWFMCTVFFIEASFEWSNKENECSSN